MNMKVIALVAAGIVLAAGVGYVVGNPEAIAALSGDLTGAADRREAVIQSTGFVVEINDAPVANVRSIRGCETTFQVVDAATGDSRFSQSSAGQTEYMPCTLTLSGPLPVPVATWLQDTLEGREPRRDVEVAYLTRDGKPFGGLGFRDAFLTGFATTTLDAAASPNQEHQTTLSFRFNQLTDQASVAGPAGTDKSAKNQSRILSSLFSTDLSPDVTRISGVNITIPAIEATTGLDAKSKSYRPGKPAIEDVTFVAVQPAGSKNVFAEWAREQSEGRDVRKDIQIHLKGSKSDVLQTYTLHDTFVTSIGAEPVTLERAPIKTVTVVKVARLTVA